MVHRLSALLCYMQQDAASAPTHNPGCYSVVVALRTQRVLRLATGTRTCDVAWYGTAYLLFITALQPVYGSVYKYFSTDVVYRLSILIFEVGSIICAAAVNSPMFIVGQAVAGFGAAGVLQGALSIISQVVPLEKRPLYMGIVISVFVVTVTIGPVLGGVFVQHSTWRWCFWINVPIGAVVLAGLTIFLKVRGATNKDRALPFKAKVSNMDPLGCDVFIGAICCLLLALQWGGQQKAWSSADVIGCLVGGFLIAALFAYWQWRRGDVALIPLRVLKKRSIWTGAVVLFFFGAQTYVVSGMVKQFGSYVPYMVVGELIAIGGQAMLTLIQPDSRTLYWAAGLVVAGLGTAMAMQLPYTAVAIVLADDDIPVGNAIAVLFYQLGGAVSISMGQTIIITTLLDLVARRLPGLSPQMVITAGAANMPALGPTPEALEVLREIWNTAIARTMILATVLLGATVPFTLGMEWLNAVRVAKQRKAAEADRDRGMRPGQECTDGSAPQTVVDIEGSKEPLNLAVEERV
ncbi:major facilitator superfamily protein [Hirsutella rhossiliensis]|uniref:Major facilitator superfamily domain-containing protein n=1 Tax=Hirsutella rhossiliensis TaxID=111463 RepID=A0A9P8SJE9_9HYPO|nr:major facilitator superfamily domain-containing protein [Hirsutella rhossiliensis]KAH0962976.1 major facilitator superfamily domain-containing protein [Hirsutella rhossiliensis]